MIYFLLKYIYTHTQFMYVYTHAYIHSQKIYVYICKSALDKILIVIEPGGCYYVLFSFLEEIKA